MTAKEFNKLKIGDTVYFIDYKYIYYITSLPILKKCVIENRSINYITVKELENKFVRTLYGHYIQDLYVDLNLAFKIVEKKLKRKINSKLKKQYLYKRYLINLYTEYYKNLNTYN